METFANPILRGCHPDPSVCRVGEDFFVVNSSFAYFPALPIHTSRDFASWTLIGHAIDRPDWLDLEGAGTNFGVWAPTIRHDGERFYVIFSLMRTLSEGETYVVTARDAAGPWSKPVRVETDGFDPSLLFDDDGRVWLTACRDSAVAGEGPGEIWLQEFDADTLAPFGPVHSIWHGSQRGVWVEGPHVYNREGRYLLIAAEGGTGSSHAVTAAWADQITGPYRSDARNPLLTHRHLGPSARVQNVGHADLVDSPTGQTWAVVLGVRTVRGVHTTGRETFLVPVSWEAEGPVFAPGEGVVPCSSAPPGPADAADDQRAWVCLRGPAQATWGPRSLALAPRDVPLASTLTPAFIGTRQIEPAYRIEAVLTDLAAGQRAGLVAFQNEERFVSLLVSGPPDARTASIVLRQDGAEQTLAQGACGDRPLLAIESDGARYLFEAGGARAQIDAAVLSTEQAGGFVGTLLGFAALGATSGPAVQFEQISSRPQDRLSQQGVLLSASR